MASERLLLGESAARKCTGMQTQYVGMWADGLRTGQPLAEDLDYISDMLNYHASEISVPDACRLAARIVLERGREVTDLLCGTCPIAAMEADEILHG